MELNAGDFRGKGRGADIEERLGRGTNEDDLAGDPGGQGVGIGSIGEDGGDGGRAVGPTGREVDPEMAPGIKGVFERSGSHGDRERSTAGHLSRSLGRAQDMAAGALGHAKKLCRGRTGGVDRCRERPWEPSG